MKEKTTSRWLIFKENSYKYLRLQSIGYDDFSNKGISDFWATNRWHALYYVKSGSGKYIVGDKKYPIHKGDFFYVKPNEPVHYIYQEEDPVQYFWYGLYPELAEEIVNIFGFHEAPVKAAKVPRRVERILDHLLDVEVASEEVYFTALSALMQILAVECAGNKVKKNTKYREDFLDNLIQLMELNYTNPQFRIETAAQMLYVSHAHMTRAFREKIGITPVAYLVELRLKHAASMITEGEYTVKQLVEASGFSDEWHFMKSFKKKFGVTVREYRDQVKI